jgi:hypothetical protein
METLVQARRKTRRKPSKPYPKFPLTAHNNGQWRKKSEAKSIVWADPQGALGSYLSVAADLHAGRQPNKSSVSENAATVKLVANRLRNAALPFPSLGDRLGREGRQISRFAQIAQINRNRMSRCGIG